MRLNLKKCVGVLSAATLVVVLTDCGGSATTTTTTTNASAPSQSTATSSATTTTSTSSASKAPSIKPFNAGGFLGGNANATFPAGQPGQVTVFVAGPLEKDKSILPVAYRNNTGEAISHVDLTATARKNGRLVGTGESQGGIPAQLQPGEVGLAYIYFETAKSMPNTGVKYEFTTDTAPADTSTYNTAPLTVGEANRTGSSLGTAIVGTAVNKTGQGLSGPYNVLVFCFAGNEVVDVPQGSADQLNDIAANAKVSFTVDLFDTKCNTFTVGVSGYFH